MANWRWIFLILVPFIAVMYVVGRAALPAGTSDDRPPLVMPGAVLSALALIPLVAALLQVPELGWSNPWVLAGITAGLVLLAAFAVREMQARALMIDVRVLRIRAVSATALALVVRYGGGAVGLAVCASAVAVGVSAPWDYLAAGALVLVLGIGTAGFLRRGAERADSVA